MITFHLQIMDAQCGSHHSWDYCYSVILKPIYHHEMQIRLIYSEAPLTSLPMNKSGGGFTTIYPGKLFFSCDQTSPLMWMSVCLSICPSVFEHSSMTNPTWIRRWLWNHIARTQGCARNDSEMHETVLLDCTTGKAVRSRFYHIHNVYKRNWDGPCLMNLTQNSYS